MSTNRTPGPDGPRRVQGRVLAQQHRQPARHRLEHGERALADRRHDHHVGASRRRPASPRRARRRGTCSRGSSTPGWPLAAGERDVVLVAGRGRDQVEALLRHEPTDEQRQRPVPGSRRAADESARCPRRCRAPRPCPAVRQPGRDVLVDRQDRPGAAEHQPAERRQHHALHQPHQRGGVVHEADVAVHDVRRAQRQAPQRRDPAGDVERRRGRVRRRPGAPRGRA